MAELKSDYFKIGDKFDYSRNMIVREVFNELDGTLRTTYLGLSNFLGFTLIPGIGLKSPAPENMVCLYDGSFIRYSPDGKPVEHIKTSGVTSPIKFQDDGTAILDLENGTDIVVSENGQFLIAKEDDKEKVEEIKEVNLSEKNLKEMVPLEAEILETLTGGALSAFDASKKDTSYNVATNGKISSKVTVNNNLPANQMFALSKGDKLVAGLFEETIKEKAQKFLAIPKTDEINEFLKTEEGQKLLLAEDGATPLISEIDEGYTIAVDSCSFNGGAGIKALAKGLTYECNGGASILKIGDRCFVDEIKTEDSKEVNGYDLALSPKFLSHIMTKQAGYSFTKKNASLVKDAPVDLLVSLLNSAGVDKNGTRQYQDGNIELMSCVLPTLGGSGSSQSVLLLKEKNTNYILHEGKFVKISKELSYVFNPATGHKTEKGLEITKQGKKGDKIFIPFKSKAKLKQVGEIYSFISGKELTESPTEKDIFQDDKHTKLNSSKKEVTASYGITGLSTKVPEEIEKKEEKTNDTSNNNNTTSNTTNTTTTDPKDDKKDKENRVKFWDTISTAFGFTMLFLAIAGVFLGPLVFDLAVLSGLAWGFTKAISFAGGFGLQANNKTTNAKNDNDSEKEQTKEKENYFEKNKEIENIDAKITTAKTKLQEYMQKGMGNSEEANKLREELIKLNQNKKILTKEQEDILSNLNSKSILDLLGPMPEIDKLDKETCRKALDDEAIVNRLAQTLLTEESEDIKNLFNNLTPAEREIIFDRVKTLKDTYGKTKDAEFVETFIEHDVLTKKQKQEQKTKNELIDTIKNKLSRKGTKKYKKQLDIISNLPSSKLALLLDNNRNLNDRGLNDKGQEYFKDFLSDLDKLDDKDKTIISEKRVSLESSMLTEEENKTLKDYDETLVQSQVDLGTKAHKQWEEHIKNQIKSKYETIAKETLGIENPTTADILALKDLRIHQATVEKILKIKKGQRTDKDNEKLKTALSAVHRVQAFLGRGDGTEAWKNKYAKLINDLNPKTLTSDNFINKKASECEKVVKNVEIEEVINNATETEISLKPITSIKRAEIQTSGIKYDYGAEMTNNGESLFGEYKEAKNKKEYLNSLDFAQQDSLKKYTASILGNTKITNETEKDEHNITLLKSLLLHNEKGIKQSETTTGDSSSEKDELQKTYDNLSKELGEENIKVLISAIEAELLESAKEILKDSKLKKDDVLKLTKEILLEGSGSELKNKSKITSEDLKKEIKGKISDGSLFESFTDKLFGKKKKKTTKTKEDDASRTK